MTSLTEKTIANIMTDIVEELVKEITGIKCEFKLNAEFENLKSYQIALINWAKEEILENFYHEI